MRTVPHVLAGIVLALASCGGSQTTISYGSGTGTLKVVANVRSSPALNIENPKTNDQFQTSFNVRVQRMVNTTLVGVSGATVKVQVGNQSYTLLEQIQPVGLYTYTANGGVQDALVTVNVDATVNDYLHNLARKGPGIQAFTNPLPGQTVSIAALPATGLHVTWTRPAAADAAQLRVSQFDTQQVPDTGAYDVPTINLRADTGAPCELTRTNSVLAANALADSQLNVGVEQSLNFVITP